MAPDRWTFGMEARAARSGWILTNSPDGDTVICCIDDPGPGEAHLRDDDEAVAAFLLELADQTMVGMVALAVLAEEADRHYLADVLRWLPRTLDLGQMVPRLLPTERLRQLAAEISEARDQGDTDGGD